MEPSGPGGHQQWPERGPGIGGAGHGFEELHALLLCTALDNAAAAMMAFCVAHRCATGSTPLAARIIMDFQIPRLYRRVAP